MKRSRSSQTSISGSTQTNTIHLSLSSKPSKDGPESSPKGQGFVHSLEALYDDNHLAADFIIGAIRAIASDLISQLLRCNKTGVYSVNWYDILISVFIAVTYMTPILICFIPYVAHLKIPIYKKVAIDQFLFSPLFTGGVVALRLLLSSDIAPGQIPLEVLTRMPNIMIYGWAFWIPGKFVVMKYASPKYQLLAGHLLSFCWNTVLTTLVA